MSVEIEATYERGILKLDQPLPLADNQRVRVTVHIAASHARRTAGLVPFRGSVEDLEYLAESPENDLGQEP
jgi:predicted DNA-binding antitoxin AbrB/MazE fold protein